MSTPDEPEQLSQSTDASTDGPAASTLKFEPARYFPPDDAMNIERILDITNGLHIGIAKNKPLCPHCFRPKGKEHAFWTECQGTCGCCGTNQHAGIVCRKIWATPRWLERTFGIRPHALPDHVQFRPSVEESKKLAELGHDISPQPFRVEQGKDDSGLAGHKRKRSVSPKESEDDRHQRLFNESRVKWLEERVNRLLDFQKEVLKDNEACRRYAAEVEEKNRRLELRISIFKKQIHWDENGPIEFPE